MRVHELAKELGFGSKDFVVKLKDMGIAVKGYMSGIDDETVELVRHEFEEKKDEEIKGNVLEIDFPITVKDFAVKVKKKPSELIKILMGKKKMLNLNSNLDEELAKEIAYDFGVNLKQKKLLDEVLEEEAIADDANAKTRAPIVTIMGHIDHGKTTLLDYIRDSNIAGKESGGITQHISVYTVDTKHGMITFVDTPGHETFTAMRARGANVTDIVILVVAADDGIMPQTEEAISHARAAGVPIIVAINKCDRENVNIDLVKQQLSKHDLTSEDWGGQTIVCELSALKGDGVEHLLEMLTLQAEVMELKADYDRSAMGIVVEAHLSSGLGPVASVIVQQGTLRRGDWVVCGSHVGKLKILKDDRGNQMQEALPSQSLEIVGLGGVPLAGDKFVVVPTEKEANVIASRRIQEAKSQAAEPPKKHTSLEDLFGQLQENEDVKDFNIILKADTFGTLEAIEGMLAKVDIKEVNLNILHKAVGIINMSDVVLAEASDAVVFGFKVPVDGAAAKKAAQTGLQIKTYQIIYELTLDLKAAIEGLLEPDIEEVFEGRARVKQVFNLTKHGIVAGSIIEKGLITRNSKCKVIREEEVIHEGKVNTLKRFKDDVRDVKEGIECGIGCGLNQIKEGDIIETFTELRTTKRVEM